MKMSRSSGAAVAKKLNSRKGAGGAGGGAC